METPFNSRSWTRQGFEILDNNHQVADAICRFLFRGFLISMSSWNYSRGGAFNEVRIYQSVLNEEYPYSEPLMNASGDPMAFLSPQQAIEYIVDHNLRPKHGWNNSYQKG